MADEYETVSSGSQSRSVLAGLHWPGISTILRHRRWAHSVKIGNPMPTFNADQALDQIEGDRETLSVLLSTFTRVSPEQLVELRGAIEDQDAEKLAALAHRFMGSLGLFAAGAAATIVRELEVHARESNFDGAKSALVELEAECRQLVTDLAAFLHTAN